MPTSIDDTELFSDESSFYGDENQAAHYEGLAATYDPEPYWSEIHPRLLSTIQHKQLKPPTPEPQLQTKRTASGNNKPTSRFLPCNQRGPIEPVTDFLARLPPSSTKQDTIGPWIFVSSPNCETEAPRDEDLATVVSEGTDLLHEFENLKIDLEAEHDRSGAKSKAPLTRKLNNHRRTLEKNIFDLARNAHLTTGKWMLFPTGDRIDPTWAAVVDATVNGDLGIQAKVATDSGGGRQTKAHLICVCTKDCQDIEDVRRVLKGLVELELVSEEQRVIYYKADVYTHLGISSQNSYGLKASLYSSKDVLAGKV